MTAALSLQNNISGTPAANIIFTTLRRKVIKFNYKNTDAAKPAARHVD